jgi:hypothetical protein
MAPSQNYAVPIINYLESQSRGPDGKVEPKKIALLEDQTFVNGDTLPYYADLRGDPFTFVGLFTTPPPKAFAVELKSYDFVLYIPQVPLNQASRYGRSAEINNEAPARAMTPQMFGLFKSDPKRLFVGTGQGQGAYVAVLERRPSSTSEPDG